MLYAPPYPAIADAKISLPVHKKTRNWFHPAFIFIAFIPLFGFATILKWPQFAQSREIAASNFEFCPLRENSYLLLFDLWKDVMEATRGSAYIHIGSDETYELGLCEQCQQKAKEIGKKGLYHLFSDKAARYILSKGRKPMIWETSMRWKKTIPTKKCHPIRGWYLRKTWEKWE